MRAPVIAWVLGGELLVATGAVASARWDPTPGPYQWVIAVGLLGAAVIHHYCSRSGEERRFGVRGGRELVDLTSLWFFPAALLLPTVPALVLLVIARALRYRIARTPATKYFYATAAVAGSMLAAHAVALTVTRERLFGVATVTSGAGHLVVLVVLVAAIVAYYLVQAVLVPVARLLASTTRPSWSELLGTTAQNAEILGALLLAALITVAAAWSPWTLLLAVPLAGAATLLLEMLDRARRESDTDPKTGLPNIRGWSTIAGPTIELASLTRPTAILIVDVDRLKKLNDQFGHLGADQILVAIADVLRHEIRPGDIPCRFGGDEFQVLLPGADLAIARAVAERLRAAVEALRLIVTHPAGGDPIQIGIDSPPVTITIGIAVAPSDGDRLAAVQAVADDRLLAGKEIARNRVYTAIPARPDPIPRPAGETNPTTERAASATR